MKIAKILLMTSLSILAWYGENISISQGILFSQAAAASSSFGTYKPYTPYVVRPTVLPGFGPITKPRPTSLKRDLLSSSPLANPASSSFTTYTNRVLGIQNSRQRLPKIGSYAALTKRIEIDNVARQIDELAKGGNSNASRIESVAIQVRTLKPSQLKKARALYSQADKIARDGTLVDENKIHHIFDKGSHRMDPLLDKFNGNRQKAMTALLRAADKAYSDGRISFVNGRHEQTRVNIDGVEVDILRGRVIDGKYRIGTASRRDIP